MIYIIAGSYAIADQIAFRRGLSPQDWRYVTDSRVLQGIDPEAEIVWGDLAWQRNDFRELRAIADMLEASPPMGHPRKGRLPKAVVGG